MELQEVDTSRGRFTTADLEPEMVVRADVGEDVVYVRTVLVADVDEMEGTVTVVLGPERMDGPYTIPVENVWTIQD